MTTAIVTLDISYVTDFQKIQSVRPKGKQIYIEQIDDPFIQKIVQNMNLTLQGYETNRQETVSLYLHFCIILNVR